MDGQRVLTIECNWRIRKLIRANLEAMGLTVQDAVSGQHALQMLGQTKPDLILVDGGPGQASSAQRAVRELNLKIPVVGLAKKQERIYLPGSAKPVAMGRRPAAHLLLRRIRDEAHRFGIEAHRKRRGKKAVASPLEKIEGLGPKRRRMLIEKFGGIDGLKKASVDDIASVKGITKEIAMRVKKTLKSTNL